jgi:hypothetical protein
VQAASAVQTDPAAQTDPGAADPAAQKADPAPRDWATLRTQYAKGDEKLEKRLARYSSPEAVIDALIAAQAKISSGSLKSVLPEKATPEQLAEWRAENGVPAKPEDYDTTLSNGMVVGEDDKPFVDKFTKQAHDLNMSQPQVQKVLEWYYADRENQVAEMRQADSANRAESEEAMRGEWGSEYKLNINLINGLLDTAPAGLKDKLFGARLADGTPLGDSPDALRWLANMARTVNPVATVAPGAGANAAQAIDTELEGLVKQMGDRDSPYWKGTSSEKLQARYRELVSVKEKLR